MERRFGLRLCKTGFDMILEVFEAFPLRFSGGFHVINIVIQ
jgi:hypothetical protein